MAKQVIYIGVAVATDGISIKRDNILNISMCVGEAYTFKENVFPQNGVYGESKLWTKYPQELAALKQNPRPLAEVMVELRAWLRQFQGTLVACSSLIDHSFLREAFQSTGKDFPFGTLPIDVGTWHMKETGRPRPTSIVGDSVAPLHVARTRWSIITKGVMPRFGAVKTGAHARRRPVDAPTDIGTILRAARRTPVLANLEDMAQRLQTTTAAAANQQATHHWREAPQWTPAPRPILFTEALTQQDAQVVMEDRD